MPANDETCVPTFGSPFRAGREDPAYQADRLGALYAFTSRLLETYARQLQAEQRRGRKLWDAKKWHEQQTARLEEALREAVNAIEERPKEIEEHERAQAEWIAKLEEAKAYWIQRAEDLEQKLATETTRTERLMRLVLRIRATRWWRIGARFGMFDAVRDEVEQLGAAATEIDDRNAGSNPPA
ncbi:MAG: hypothetical protein JXA69_07470 [Phycisphaerae bacterium]|nr:hypothetical protein [Phycisphaerae bacterium]